LDEGKIRRQVIDVDTHARHFRNSAGTSPQSRWCISDARQRSQLEHSNDANLVEHRHHSIRLQLHARTSVTRWQRPGWGRDQEQWVLLRQGNASATRWSTPRPSRWNL